MTGGVFLDLGRTPKSVPRKTCTDSRRLGGVAGITFLFVNNARTDQPESVPQAKTDVIDELLATVGSLSKELFYADRNQ